MTLLIVSLVFAGALFMVPSATVTNEAASSANIETFAFAGFDSENITVVLLTPANESEIAGTVDLTFNITSVNGPLNLTLFVDDDIHPDYNNTEISLAVNATTTVNITVDTTVLPEGLLNFTFLFEDNTTGIVDKETYHLRFLVNNHGAPSIKMISPSEGETIIGLADILLNITSDYPEVYMNLTVDGELDPDFNMTLVPATLANHTLNCSRYDNGHHVIKITIWTEEGLQASVEREVIFLDYVRFAITGMASYARVSGNQTFDIKVFTPYDTVTLTAYVDDVLAPDVVNITLHEGQDSFIMDTTYYSEGEHNFTFIAYDAFGHKWETTMIFVVDNYGVPEVHFVAPTEDIVVGIAEFTIQIDSNWENVTITVLVDGEEIPELTNITVNTGEYTFTIDTSQYSKWQHEVTVKVETLEGETAETSEMFGFANFRLEEIASIIVILGVAFVIPIRRKIAGYPIKSILIVDVIFILVTAGVFLTLGVTSYSLMVWHINLASIWALGSALIFTNWVLPLFEKVEEE